MPGSMDNEQTNTPPTTNDSLEHHPTNSQPIGDLSLLLQVADGANQHASELIDNLPQTSPLYTILTTSNYIQLIPNKSTHKLSISDQILLTTAMDATIHSVPYSISSFYIKLLIAAPYEQLNLDIPYEVQYVANGGTRTPYTKQLQAYGLNLLTADASEPTPKDEDYQLYLVHLPEFNCEAYCNIRNLSEMEMGKRFLTTLLQTQIRNNHFLVNISKKSGPQKHTYATKTAERLLIRPKPKIIPNLQPIPAAKFPCTRCLVTATILTTTKDRYTRPLTLKPRFKSADQFAETLPSSIRPTFLAIFEELTQGIPNHSERRSCPFASQPEIRDTFQRTAPIKSSNQSPKETYKHVVEPCKNCNLCAKCGRPRNINNEKHHQSCSTNYKQCPAKKTADCRIQQSSVKVTHPSC